MPGKAAGTNPASMSPDPTANEDNSISLSTSSALSLPDEGFQWETVHTEAATQLTFDTVNDTFIGLYIGQEEIVFTNKKGLEDDFTQLNFLVGDEPYAINAGYDLLRGMKNVPPNTFVRIQLRKLVDVGQQSPLKSYRVDVAGPGAVVRTPGSAAQAALASRWSALLRISWEPSSPPISRACLMSAIASPNRSRVTRSPATLRQAPASSTVGPRPSRTDSASSQWAAASRPRHSRHSALPALRRASPSRSWSPTSRRSR